MVNWTNESIDFMTSNEPLISNGRMEEIWRVLENWIENPSEKQKLFIAIALVRNIPLTAEPHVYSKSVTGDINAYRLELAYSHFYFHNLTMFNSTRYFTIEEQSKNRLSQYLEAIGLIEYKDKILSTLIIKQ